MFYWSQIVCKFLTLSIEFQKFFSITGTFLFHSMSGQFWSLNLRMAYSFPVKQHMHFVCNSYTRIMFYKQCSYWTTGYPFPKLWWSLLLIACLAKNGNLIVIKRFLMEDAIEITVDFILETNRKPIPENIEDIFLDHLLLYV